MLAHNIAALVGSVLLNSKESKLWVGIPACTFMKALAHLY